MRSKLLFFCLLKIQWNDGYRCPNLLLFLPRIIILRLVVYGSREGHRVGWVCLGGQGSLRCALIEGLSLRLVQSYVCRVELQRLNHLCSCQLPRVWFEGGGDDVSCISLTKMNVIVLYFWFLNKLLVRTVDFIMIPFWTGKNIVCQICDEFRHGTPLEWARCPAKC